MSGDLVKNFKIINTIKGILLDTISQNIQISTDTTPWNCKLKIHQK